MKLPPHSRESEMMALGSSICNSHSLTIVCEGLREEDFYFDEHKVIFHVLKEQYLERHPVDVHFLCEELKKQNMFSRIGGAAYLVALAQYSGTSVYTEEYVKEIHRLSILRKIALRSRKAEVKALDGKENPKNLLEELKEDFKDLEKGFRRNFSFSSSKERMEREDAFLRQNKGEAHLGLRTQFIEEFNDHLLGLRGLNLLAAAPNTGKTALTIQLGIDAILTEIEACLVYVSLEMSADEIFRRMILSLAEIDYRTFVFGIGDEAHQEKIMQAKQMLFSFNESKRERNPIFF